MGKRHRRALHSSYRILMLHPLKWHFQPERRSRSWAESIRRERTNITDQQDLRSDIKAIDAGEIAMIYRRAVRLAAQETALPLSTFPQTCPNTDAQLRDHHYLPE
ncbi:DUF29 domain-containing protein [Jiella sonneratiae]|uniref:DUF29 domain-containing protein n=1 Tax=Jiella sonneratiae TaxID=2816856 RepID=A0ABS3J4W0_9HYPH|nr:DUF29 domain-containing protein [Jiella sonneratiae]MBO0904165.1 DUF29 domain-containing protein [Jiella sonneratiae]